MRMGLSTFLSCKSVLTTNLMRVLCHSHHAAKANDDSDACGDADHRRLPSARRRGRPAHVVGRALLDRDKRRNAVKAFVKEFETTNGVSLDLDAIDVRVHPEQLVHLIPSLNNSVGDLAKRIHATTGGRSKHISDNDTLIVYSDALAMWVPRDGNVTAQTLQCHNLSHRTCR